MKKFILNPLLLFILLLFSGSVAAQELSKDQLKERLDSFYNSSRFKQHQGWTKEDVKALPKYDRPDLAA